MGRRLVVAAAICALTLLNYFQFPGHTYLQADTQIYVPILEHIWDYAFDPQTNVVDVLVSRLRGKVDRDFDTKLIHTLRGVGYSLQE